MIRIDSKYDHKEKWQKSKERQNASLTTPPSIDYGNTFLRISLNFLELYILLYTLYSLTAETGLLL